MAIVTLAYRPAPLPPGSGVLVAGGGSHVVKAVTYSSQKWSQLSGGTVIVRASIGRHREEAVLQRDDAELVSLAVTDVAALTGLPEQPIDSRVTRWGGALPQYAVGHVERVRRIHESVGSAPGLAAAGAAYDGVGIPACIRSGTLAAERVAAHLRESVHG
jgi:oxygen-dependent protoporphyrinogen oxidase